jgi:hypothetical protein
MSKFTLTTWAIVVAVIVAALVVGIVLGFALCLRVPPIPPGPVVAVMGYA